MCASESNLPPLICLLSNNREEPERPLQQQSTNWMEFSLLATSKGAMRLFAQCSERCSLFFFAAAEQQSSVLNQDSIHVGGFCLPHQNQITATSIDFEEV